MNKYIIRIEKLDYNHNLKHQHQFEITEEIINEIQKYHGVDALDEAWKQAKHEFFKYLKENDSTN